MTTPIPGFDAFDFTDGGIAHVVYRKGTGPAVLLMRELPGMTEACIEWAAEIAANGFTVFIPLLFGEPYDDNAIGFMPRLCISQEINLFASGGGSPVVGWLRALGRHAHAERGGPGVGVIGMCLTGNFAIALMADETVLAPVASQPALPLSAALPVIGDIADTHAALGVTPEELAAAKTRAAQGVRLMCLRFSNDSISPVERFEALRTAFGEAFYPIVIDSAPGNTSGLRRGAHSVLTGEYKAGDPDHPTRKARNAVIAFLTSRLVAS